MEQVRALIEKYYDTVIEHRRWLHAHPELTSNEEKTAAYIADTLRKMGLEPTEHVGGYGVTAVIEGRGEGKCVGLRADIDALPIPESTGAEFASVNAGISHSCGHDCHTAMLLGAAYVLNEMRGEFDGKVKLIFQPAEEDPMASGARKMIAEGVLENPKVDAVFGQHVWPQYPVGQVAIRNGAMMASSDRFFITVRGKSSHGSAPEHGIDAIAITGHVLTALQTIVSRNVSPLDSAVVTIGKIWGGNRYNVIADEVKMEGTCRNLNPALRNSMPARMEKILRGIVEGLGGTVDFEYFMGYSPTVNDPDQFALVREVIVDTVGEEGLVIPENSALGGEDFSFYCERVPSAFFWLGCSDPNATGEIHPIHHGGFLPLEEALHIGMEVMVTSALRYLAK